MAPARALIIAARPLVAAGCLGVHRKHTLPPPPPPPHEYRVIFPEGFTRGQMIDRVGAVAQIATRKRHGRPVKLKASAYDAASKHVFVPCFSPRKWGDSEGFLFPARYDFIFKTTSKQLVAHQLQTFCSAWRDIDLTYAHRKNLTDYDVLKIASLIQGEAVVDSDRPKIAAVIYNRLHLGMPLGIDAALRYALHIPGTESIHESQLQNPTDFNLRLHAGLPPTPIDNPGAASLRAAAHPAKVDYLYFVAKPDKRHHYFTASGSQFQAYLCAHGYGC